MGVGAVIYIPWIRRAEAAVQEFIAPFDLHPLLLWDAIVGSGRPKKSTPQTMGGCIGGCIRCGMEYWPPETHVCPDRMIANYDAKSSPTEAKVQGQWRDAVAVLEKAAPREMFYDTDDPLCLVCRVSPLSAEASSREDRCGDCRKAGRTAIKPGVSVQ